MLHAARAGFDGVCTNEHHQNAYGFMPSPNLMGSVLAKLTNDLDVAIVQMGMTLPTTSPHVTQPGGGTRRQVGGPKGLVLHWSPAVQQRKPPALPSRTQTLPLMMHTAGSAQTLVGPQNRVPQQLLF